jgi:hypothetical protein
MSQWARNNPEAMEEIARLPMNEQNAAMRSAVGYDPDFARDELRANGRLPGYVDEAEYPEYKPGQLTPDEQRRFGASTPLPPGVERRLEELKEHERHCKGCDGCEGPVID